MLRQKRTFLILVLIAMTSLVNANIGDFSGKRIVRYLGNVGLQRKWGADGVQHFFSESGQCISMDKHFGKFVALFPSYYCYLYSEPNCQGHKWTVVGEVSAQWFEMESYVCYESRKGVTKDHY